MSAAPFTLAAVIGVSLLSLLGIIFFLFNDRLIRKILLYLVSFSTGALLGDVFLHILPELAETTDTFASALKVVLLGIVFSFVTEKIIHWRHCHQFPDQEHDHQHSLGTMSVIAEALHNALDGVVIAAAFLASPAIGLSTTFAVMFHEIPHEIGSFAVLLHSGMEKGKALLYNLLAASMCVLGAIVVLVLSRWIGPVEAMLLPFAAGNLLYIAGSDLIPELHKHTKVHQGILQLIAMVAGMALMQAVLLLE